MAISSGRPGGLTTMAIMNFVIGGWCCLMLLFYTIALLQPEPPPEAQPRADGRPTNAAIIAMGAMVIVRAALLTVSGIGYIRQSWVLGWILGLCYGVLGVIEQIVVICLLQQEIAVANVIGLLYPVETAFFLLFVFRRDFGTR